MFRGLRVILERASGFNVEANFSAEEVETNRNIDRIYSLVRVYNNDKDDTLDLPGEIIKTKLLIHQKSIRMDDTKGEIVSLAAILGKELPRFVRESAYKSQR